VSWVVRDYNGSHSSSSTLVDTRLYTFRGEFSYPRRSSGETTLTASWGEVCSFWCDFISRLHTYLKRPGMLVGVNLPNRRPTQASERKERRRLLQPVEHRSLTEFERTMASRTPVKQEAGIPQHADPGDRRPGADKIGTHMRRR